MSLSVAERKKQLKEIFDGWTNDMFPSEKIREMAEKRYKICISCWYCSKVSALAKIPVLKRITYIRCDLCKCPISKKTKSPTTKCPKKYWK